MDDVTVVFTNVFERVREIKKDIARTLLLFPSVCNSVYWVSSITVCLFLPSMICLLFFFYQRRLLEFKRNDGLLGVVGKIPIAPELLSTLLSFQTEVNRKRTWIEVLLKCRFNVEWASSSQISCMFLLRILFSISDDFFLCVFINKL